MVKFNTFLDFYGSFVKQFELNLALKEQTEHSQKLMSQVLAENKELKNIFPTNDRFTKYFEWFDFREEVYKQNIQELYPGDFVYFNCLSGPVSEQSQFNLYSFLCQLHEKKVNWCLVIPALDWRLKEFYVHDFYVKEIFLSNSKNKEYKHLIIKNYLSE